MPARVPRPIAGFLAWMVLQCLASPVAPAASSGIVLTVDAGRLSRTNTPVCLPWHAPGPDGELQAADGGRIPYQMADGKLWYVEPGLPRGAQHRYVLHPGVPERIGPW